MTKYSTIIDEKTKVSLQFHNLWPILVAFFLFGITYATVITKQDMLIANQRELTQEVKEWRRQYEQRLGKAEIDISNLTTRFEDRFNNIKESR